MARKAAASVPEFSLRLWTVVPVMAPCAVMMVSTGHTEIAWALTAPARARRWAPPQPVGGTWGVKVHLGAVCVWEHEQPVDGHCRMALNESSPRPMPGAFAKQNYQVGLVKFTFPLSSDGDCGHGWSAGVQIGFLSPSHLVSGFTCTGLWSTTWEFSFPVMVTGKYLSRCCCVVILPVCLHVALV